MIDDETCVYAQWNISVFISAPDDDKFTHQIDEIEKFNPISINYLDYSREIKREICLLAFLHLSGRKCNYSSLKATSI